MYFHFLEIQAIFLIFKKINQCKKVHVSLTRQPYQLRVSTRSCWIV